MNNLILFFRHPSPCAKTKINEGYKYSILGKRKIKFMTFSKDKYLAKNYFLFSLKLPAYFLSPSQLLLPKVKEIYLCCRISDLLKFSFFQSFAYLSLHTKTAPSCLTNKPSLLFKTSMVDNELKAFLILDCYEINRPKNWILVAQADTPWIYHEVYWEHKIKWKIFLGQC